MEAFTPLGPLWRRPIRPALRFRLVFSVAMAASSAGARWWLHDSVSQIVRTIGLILVVGLATDLVRYQWWRRGAARQPATGPE
jgi:hypothetical protein